MTYDSFLSLDKFCTKSKFYKSNPYTIQNIKLYLKINNIDLELLNENYKDSDEKLIFKDSNNYYYSITISQLQSTIKRGFMPRIYDKHNIFTVKNIINWCKLNNKSFELLSDTYNGNNKNLKWKCLKDGCEEEFEAPWKDILNGNCCPYCAGKQVGLSNCLANKNPKLVSEWHPTLNGDLTPWDVTCGSARYAWWKCKECNYSWYAQIRSRNSGNGCSECCKSKGEKKIDEVLINNNWIKISQKEFDQLEDKYKFQKMYFIYQMKYDGLVGLGNGLLSYDYFIPKYNLLIEYQGEQHERYIKGFHESYDDFLKQLEHDKRKREYAKNNNIKLLEIWYYDFDNIDDILIDILKEV